MAGLELRPNCELCDKDLPPNSAEARICSYECTYCAHCAGEVLHNVCPTCGGNFVPRPIRPMKSWRPEEKLGLENHPASGKCVRVAFSKAEIEALVTKLKSVPPQLR